MNWKWIYEGDKRVIKQRTFLTDESIVNYFSLEKCPYVHRFWKPDQRAGHAQPVLIYSESRKQHVWFISETFQKVKYVSVWYHIKPGFSNTWTTNFQMFQLDLEKAEEPEIKLPTSAGSSKKEKSSRKTSTFALLTMPKPLSVWITRNCGKFFKRWNTRPPDQPPEKSVCRSRNNT